MPCGSCGGQHAITKYRLFAPGGKQAADFDTVEAARAENDRNYKGAGTIRTVRVPKPAGV